MVLVAFGNVADFDTNLAFVRHVLAMDTITVGGRPGAAHDPDVTWRAITTPMLQTAAYLAIIAWEGLALLGLLLLHLPSRDWDEPGAGAQDSTRAMAG